MRDRSGSRNETADQAVAGAATESLYRRLLEEHLLPVDDPTVDQETAGQLVRRGLAVRHPDGIMPVDAATAIRAAIAGAQQRLTADMEAIVSAAAGLDPSSQHASGNGAGGRPPVQVSAERRRNHLLSGRLRLAAGEEILTLFTAGQPPWATHGVNPAAGSGVTARTLIESGVLVQPGTSHTLAAAADRGEAVRMHARLPLRMMVIDRCTAYVGLDASGVQQAAIVHAPPLVAALADYFERLWAAAVPVTDAPDEQAARAGPSATQRRILQMLAAGASDGTIARQLGISERTVRRWVASLLADLGASTRFACAYQAIRQGWLTTPTTP